MKKIIHLKILLIPIFIFIIFVIFMVRGMWITWAMISGMVKSTLNFVHSGENNISHASSLLYVAAFAPAVGDKHYTIFHYLF